MYTATTGTIMSGAWNKGHLEYSEIVKYSVSMTEARKAYSFDFVLFYIN